MKKLSILICSVFALVTTSCNDYLDINKNPNQPTEVGASLVLPQAMAATALVLNTYNTYGMQLGGYASNAGGYGGFNETVSYAYTPNNYNNLWPVSYDNLEDYQYVINKTTGNDLDIYSYAVAKIMKAYGMQLLVDAYNDVPYSEALQGSDHLTPKYDDAKTIYAALATELDDAIAAINKGKGLAVKNDITNFDIIFKGNMDSWLKLANTIKLRVLIRANGKVTFTNTSFDPVGFLTADALINPGYARDNNRQNPAWNTWGFGYTGASGLKSWIPTTFVMTFYDGNKLSDPSRGAAMYYNFPLIPPDFTKVDIHEGTSQLGFERDGTPKSPEGSFWYPSSNRVGTAAGNATGALKGPNASYPLFTASESYFLQAEGAVLGMTGISGSAKSLFESGIAASFRYLYQLPDGSSMGNAASDAAAYIASNTNNNDPAFLKYKHLVQFDLATSQDQKIEAIITQKYIALNMVHSHEGWNEYRRTGYPKVTTIGATVTQADAATTFASLVSQSTRADKLPSRILYPQSELQYNPKNVPSGVSSFNSLIFWAK